MAKLALVTLALAAIVLFTKVSAYTTTITTTTIEDDNLWFRTPKGPKCRRKIPIQEVNHCQMHLTEGPIYSEKLKMAVENGRPSEEPEQHHLQQCCNQLNNLQQECQCNAIQTAYDKARAEVSFLHMRHVLSKAYDLPNDCNLQVKHCPIRSPLGLS